MGIQVTLFPIEGYRCARERDPFTELWILSAGHEDRVFSYPVGFHAALDQVDVDIHEATHLNATAEGNLAVALGAAQVSDREVRPVNEYRVEGPGALRQVLNVLVPTVF